MKLSTVFCFFLRMFSTSARYIKAQNGMSAKFKKEVIFFVEFFSNAKAHLL